MSENFDPYYKWLQIPPEEQPPNLYRLLGLCLLEADPDVIHIAADQRMVHLRTFQTSQHAQLTQKLLNEVAAARVCLLNPQKKAAYDATVRSKFHPSRPVAIENVPKQHVETSPILSDIPFGQQPAQRFVPARLPKFRSHSPGKTNNISAASAMYAVATMIGIAAAFWLWMSFDDHLVNLQPQRAPARLDSVASVAPARRSAAQTATPPVDRIAHLPAMENPRRPVQAESNSWPEATPKGITAPPDGAGRQNDPLNQRPIPNPSFANADVSRGLGPISNPTLQPKPSVKPHSNNPFDPPPFVTTLPTGRVLNINQVFLTGVRERFARYAAMRPSGTTMNSTAPYNTVSFTHTNGTIAAVISESRGKLHGPLMANYESGAPGTIANYVDGEMDGNLLTWNEDGSRELFAQYVKGKEHGFICYFADDDLRLVEEMKLDRPEARHLFRYDVLMKTFVSDDQSDEELRQTLGELGQVHKRIKEREAKVKRAVTTMEQKRRRAVAGANSARGRAEIMARDAQRGAEGDASTREFFRRLYGGR